MRQTLATQLADGSEVKFTDLGCGAGANLRYTALLVPPGIPQRWRLFDLIWKGSRLAAAPA